ncbi:NAD dependent epimerase/dehydratase family protein [Rhodobacteraceae bacterium THAF1]|uniref:SDR family oxidoreductase n=1 Tax=Palleronia sp. THAF1 TaxID=2587842 RepID=UPI000F3EBB01|nr:SDR family oxidoreductase [Palleronia sp. THAF1]QFU09973.1 NAD dependent epimerase/dehydratase family protein [Palleronia sp. THAF1]VDC17122.1 NAD dependent epimerase/dehydratase family protein [Rhodobacteraceae bacterium THAF1]
MSDHSPSPVRLLCIGCGYSARALAARVIANGGEVVGTTRSEDKAQGLRDMGITPVIWPGTPLAPHLDWATHIVHSVAPDDDGDPVLTDHGREIADAQPNWFAYLSTTGVYGDHDGAWVDEDSPLAPSTTRGAQRVRAETGWQALAAQTGLPLHIFRLAGIYGPGRGPFAKVRNGTARRIVKPGQVFSRTHVEDIAQVLHRSMQAPAPGSIYNVCDDDPAPPQDVIAHAADLLDVPRPPEIAFADADMSPMARSFYAESKRVRNDRIKRHLGVVLRYPTYREGLAALLTQED